MAKEDLRRYSSAEIDEMNRRGEVVPTPDDAPTVDLDEDFWRELEAHFVPLSAMRSAVELKVRRTTIDFFNGRGDDATLEMSRVLDAYARSHMKKAS